MSEPYMPRRSLFASSATYAAALALMDAGDRLSHALTTEGEDRHFWAQWARSSIGNANSYLAEATGDGVCRFEFSRVALALKSEALLAKVHEILGPPPQRFLLPNQCLVFML